VHRFDWGSLAAVQMYRLFAINMSVMYLILQSIGTHTP
jgi:hypothetical protein